MASHSHPLSTYTYYKNLIDAYLRNRLQGEQELLRPMRYTSLAPSKRLRPVLVCLSAQTVGGCGDSVVQSACGVELLHVASLILDDLPCMDDALTRRWQTASHLVFGESTVILTSLSFISECFSLITENSASLRLTAEVTRKTIQRATHALRETIDGQVADLALTRSTSFDSVERCYRQKSGALLAFSIGLGARLSGASERAIAELEECGYEFGEAFQMHDDLLDYRASDETGKEQRHREKLTYCSLFGIRATEARAQTLLTSAIRRLDSFGENPLSPLLADLIGQWTSATPARSFSGSPTGSL